MKGDDDVQKNYILINRHFKDLNPISMGWQSCAPGYSFGPSVRKYTLIHYVESGKGRLEKGGRIYPVQAGDAFLILPGETAFYQADKEDPWTYRWFNFDGELSAAFRNLPPVFPAPSDCFRDMLSVDEASPTREYYAAGLLFRLYSELFAGEKHKNDYVRQVRDYISAMYMQEVRVEALAETLNLDRRYLSRLFKEKTGESVQDYLISVRMEEAKKLLARGYGIAEAAFLCGYPDPSNFSRMFKRRFGVSPAGWKKEN